MTYISHYTSPLGAMTIASDGENLIGLWFDGQKYDRANLRNEQLLEKSLPIFGQTKKWLDTYFSGAIPDFTPPLHLTGSDFRQRVLQQLMKIPYGHTMTYGEIAKQIAQMRNPSLDDMFSSRASRGAQAVGGAVGHNPISIIIPCHRVLGTQNKLSPLTPPLGSAACQQQELSTKALTGYAGGLDRKLWLLTHEQKHKKV